VPEHSSDQERVAFALKTEHDGSGFYDQAKDRTSHKLARAAFELLSREELRHVALIEALGKRLGGEDASIDAESPDLKSLQFSIKTIYEGATDEPATHDLEPAEAYKKAIELEHRISALYSRYASECDSDEAKRLFKVLYREEQDHLTLLEDMFEYLTNPEGWFIDRDMTMLDGG
jgi:rubrerythrin